MAAIQYGNMVAVCQLHNGEADRFGTLVDPNGHMWLLCSDCIKGLWDAAHWTKLQEQADEAAEARLAQRLSKLLSEKG